MAVCEDSDRTSSACRPVFIPIFKQVVTETRVEYSRLAARSSARSCSNCSSRVRSLESHFTTSPFELREVELIQPVSVERPLVSGQAQGARPPAAAHPGRPQHRHLHPPAYQTSSKNPELGAQIFESTYVDVLPQTADVSSRNVSSSERAHKERTYYVYSPCPAAARMNQQVLMR